MCHNSLRSDKWHMSSNAFSGEPRGSQLPSPRRSGPGVLPALGVCGSEGRERKVVEGEVVLAEAGRCAGPFGLRGIARLWGPIASGFLSGKVFGRRGIARLCVGELIYKKMRVSGW